MLDKLIKVMIWFRNTFGNGNDEGIGFVEHIVRQREISQRIGIDPVAKVLTVLIRKITDRFVVQNHRRYAIETGVVLEQILKRNANVIKLPESVEMEFVDPVTKVRKEKPHR